MTLNDRQRFLTNICREFTRKESGNADGCVNTTGNLLFAEIGRRDIIGENIDISPTIVEKPFHEPTIQILIGNFTLLDKVAARIEPYGAATDKMITNKLNGRRFRETGQGGKNDLPEWITPLTGPFPAFKQAAPIRALQRG
jgi:hypothetical protein